MARDAALLHTASGDLDSALELFVSAIAAFHRAGNVAQLVITLASVPALFERLDRLRVAAILYGAMTREPASFHHVPGLSDLGERVAAKFGRAALRRLLAEGAAMDLNDAAAYARDQLEVAHRDLKQQAHIAPGGLTPTGSAGLAPRRRRSHDPRHRRAAVHLVEDRRPSHPAHLHQDRRHQSRGRHPVGARSRGRGEHCSLIPPRSS